MELRDNLPRAEFRLPEDHGKIGDMSSQRSRRPRRLLELRDVYVASGQPSLSSHLCEFDSSKASAFSQDASESQTILDDADSQVLKAATQQNYADEGTIERSEDNLPEGGGASSAEARTGALQEVSVGVTPEMRSSTPPLQGVSVQLCTATLHSFLTEGTSPILRVLARLVEPTTGKISWSGVFANWRRPQAVAYLPRGIEWVSDLTVREELMTALAQAGSNIDHDHFSSIVEALELADCEDTPVVALEAHVAYKVAIAKTLMLGARLVLLEEPTLALAEVEARELLGSLRSLAEAGFSVAIQTRSPEVSATCDTVFLLIDGVLLGEIEAPELSALRLEYSVALSNAQALRQAQELHHTRLNTALIEHSDDKERSETVLAERESAPFIEDEEQECEADEVASGSDADGLTTPRWVPTRHRDTGVLVPIPDATLPLDVPESNISWEVAKQGAANIEAEVHVPLVHQESDPAQPVSQAADEASLATTSLPQIPKPVALPLNADSEEVIQRAQDILKELPGSVVPRDEETVG